MIIIMLDVTCYKKNNSNVIEQIISMISSLDTIKVPCHLEPTAWDHSFRWPDGSTLVTWKQGKALIWDPIPAQIC